MSAYSQGCPKCTGALAIGERALNSARHELERLRADAREMRRSVRMETDRSNGRDPSHIHIGRPLKADPCTIQWHRDEAARERTALVELEDHVVDAEDDLIRQSGAILAAARVLMAGCDLCGRKPLALRGETVTA